MLRYALATVLSLSLLLQLAPPAWAASGPAAAAAEAETATPPCHGAADAAEPAAAPQPVMPCCGDLDRCLCLIGCGAATAPAPRISATLAYATAHFEHTGARPAPLPAHPQRLLRPPTFLHES